MRDQVSALRRGFFEMMPSKKINVFTVDKLEQLIGGVKEEGLKLAETKQVLFATYAFCSEGVDVPSLDTILFTTPRSDVIQCVGRISRVHADKKTPLVVDFVDSPYVFRNQYKKRSIYYKTLGGNISNLDQDLNPKICAKRTLDEYSEDKSKDEVVVMDKSLLSNFSKKFSSF